MAVHAVPDSSLAELVDFLRNEELDSIRSEVDAGRARSHSQDVG